MMHPPFDHLSKGPVSNQAMRGSHPHHCEQLAIFDGVINICPDAKSISRHAHKKNGTAAIRGRAIPCSGRCFKPKCRLHSTQRGALVVFHGQVGANPSPTKPSAPLTPRHLELD
jgi:hypothetical protein